MSRSTHWLLLSVFPLAVVACDATAETNAPPLPAVLTSLVQNLEAKGGGELTFFWHVRLQRLFSLCRPLALQLVAGAAVRDQAALSALAFVYAFVPCVLKLAACAALVRFKRSK